MIIPRLQKPAMRLTERLFVGATLKESNGCTENSTHTWHYQQFQKNSGLAVFCKPAETVSVMGKLGAHIEIKLIQSLSSILMMWFSPH